MPLSFFTPDPDDVDALVPGEVARSLWGDDHVHGVALSGLGQGELACENFAKLRERYPNVAPRFKQRLAEEAQKAQCPAG